MNTDNSKPSCTTNGLSLVVESIYVQLDMRFFPYHHHALRARANDGVWRACRTQLSAFGASRHIFDAKNEICI